MIRFLINTTVSKRDIYGNCYNYSIVTSTKTGKRLAINSGWGSDGGNIRAMLRQAGLEWNEISYTDSMVGIREHGRLKANIANFVHEHNVTHAMFFELER